MFQRSRHTIERIDPELAAVIQQESRRLEDHIELIASENHRPRRACS
jgi:glycine hydroxymethyltransferase